MQPVSTQKLILIFEAVNETLQELFVGATSLPLAVVQRRHRDQLPPSISHWRADHKITYHAVECGLSAKFSSDFLPAYARSAHTGWKTFVDPMQ
jgi:hypothetical protein